MTSPKNTKWDAVILNKKDPIATALKNLSSGDPVRVKSGETQFEVSVNEDIPLCHKFSIAKIPAGEPIRKYGEVIGAALVDIAAGCHVHVHNLESLRAKSS